MHELYARICIRNSLPNDPNEQHAYQRQRGSKRGHAVFLGVPLPVIGYSANGKGLSMIVSMVVEGVGVEANTFTQLMIAKAKILSFRRVAR